MSNEEFTDETLNLFIDGQLDSDDLDAIRKAMLEDKALRERVCQLKAVRELVCYAYSDVPAAATDAGREKPMSGLLSRAVAASVTLIIGFVLGWTSYEYGPDQMRSASAENTFQYVSKHVAVDHGQRKIVLQIDSGDLKVVNAALNEVDHLLETYRKANMPMQLDVVTNKSGIDILRPDISPYIERIQRLMDVDGVSFYACQRSIAKARKKENADIVLMPAVKTDKTAREIIPERLEEGWVYIKA